MTAQRQSCPQSEIPGGKKGIDPQGGKGNSNSFVGGPVQFTAGTNNNGAAITGDSHKGRKRFRKEVGFQGPRIEPHGESTSMNPPTTVHQQERPGKTLPQTRMIGNKKVFVFDDGTKTTVNMQHQQGNRYTLLADDDEVQCERMALEEDGGTPYDPGEQHVGTPHLSGS